MQASISHCTNLILDLNVDIHSLKSRGIPEFPALSSLFYHSLKKFIFYDFAFQVLTQEFHISRAVNNNNNNKAVSKSLQIISLLTIQKIYAQ